MENKKRAHVVISGRVQGVFFRAETQRAAQTHNVLGWVRNRGDGSVEAVFEGEDVNVDAMIEWCWRGSPLSRVADVAVEPADFVDEFNTFSIRY